MPDLVNLLTRLLARHRRRTDPVTSQVRSLVAMHPPDLAARLHHAADNLLLPVLQADDKVACKLGCTACCRYTVAVYEPEIEGIRAELVKQSNEEKQAIIQRAQAWSQGQLCPLNVDGACVVYSVRPLTCRGCNGYEPEECAKLDRTTIPPMNELAFALGRAICTGVEAGGVGYGLLPQILQQIIPPMLD